MVSRLEVIRGIIKSTPTGMEPDLSISQWLFYWRHEDRKARITANAAVFTVPATYGSPFVKLAPRARNFPAAVSVSSLRPFVSPYLFNLRDEDDDGFHALSPFTLFTRFLLDSSPKALTSI
ncbi:hypothetical protein BGAL_0573g00030 [Botrytis galanthina]|uniref:Uncharacterized protein n=1 Tax=Botrytis galanthina TaxID=278940 RepID=A0A4S8QIT6_9HELO|nr:hypothetical protein BGAL_0573g00030 [Botrytis galanthina]